MPPASDLASAKVSANPLTGAEALAELVRSFGVATVFAYPGTSELALCDAISAAGLRLVNSRGDKEAVFMAAGANLIRPGYAAGLVHGARGLTNALGAVADIRRTEVGVLLVVGMASRTSAPFLPPHAETDLLPAASHFACATFDCSQMEGLDATELLKITSAALQAVTDWPAGPVLLGIPQDLLSARFIRRDQLRGPRQPDGEPLTRPNQPQSRPAHVHSPGPVHTASGGLTSALDLLRSARRPVILSDDYLLRTDTAEIALAAFADALSAPILQVAYRRGPMLFQRLRRERTPLYVGSLDPADGAHGRLLANADLLVTVEDRNMYPRVVGALPVCPKVALTSNLPATAKNGYLSDQDVVIIGHVEPLLEALTAGLLRERPRRADRRANDGEPVGTPPSGSANGRALVRALAAGVATVPRVSIVDDSQMFGGLVSLHYDLLPPDTRVFGSHGGFVGSGLATAVGAAQADPLTPIVCFVGDQGFVNGVQALAVAGQLQAPLLIIVCNNGSSVSLRRQARFDGLALHDNTEFIGNSANLSYADIAAGYGLPAQRVSWLGGADEQKVERLTHVVAQALDTPRAYLVELLTPGDTDFWRDIWITKGFEAAAPVSG